MTFKSANWTDAKGNALNGTVEMTLTLYRIGGGDERKATIPVKMENGSFSTMVDAESLFGLTTTELAGSGKLYILRVSSPDGGEAKTSFFTFVAGTKPTPAPTTEPTTPAPTTKPSAEPTTPAPSTKPSAKPTSKPTTPSPSADPSPAPTTQPAPPAPSADPNPAPTTQPAPQPAPPAPAPSADPNPAPTTQPAPPAPAPDAPAPSPEVPAPEVPAPQAPAPEAPPADAGAPAAPGSSPEAPAAEPVAPPTIIATLPATPEEEPAPARPEASPSTDPSASPSAKSTEPKPTDPPRSPVTDGSQLTADNAGSLSGGRQGDRVSLVLPKDKAKEGDWVAVFLYPSGESAGWVQVDHSNSVQVDISNIDAGSHKLAIASRDSELLGWVQLEIARTDTVNTDLMDKANSTPVKEAVLGGDDWMLISAAGILTAGAAAYMFLARPRARRPIQ